MQMLPNYLLDEATIRESGESTVLDLQDETNQSLLLTLGITHAVEQESIHVDVFGSQDGTTWTAKPIMSFPRKFYCGTYQALLQRNEFRFLKAVWHAERWGRGDLRPFFRVYVFTQAARLRALAAA